MELNEIEELAQKLTDDIFECGGAPNSLCNRIQFMGGSREKGTEINQGGFIRTSFKTFIQSRILVHTGSK